MRHTLTIVWLLGCGAAPSPTVMAPSTTPASDARPARPTTHAADSEGDEEAAERRAKVVCARYDNLLSEAQACAGLTEQEQAQIGQVATDHVAALSERGLDDSTYDLERACEENIDHIIRVVAGRCPLPPSARS